MKQPLSKQKRRDGPVKSEAVLDYGSNATRPNRNDAGQIVVALQATAPWHE